MEWYEGALLILSTAIFGSMYFVIEVVSALDELRIENKKLNLELNRIKASKGYS